MTLDEQVLAEAKEIRGRLIDLETQTAHARVDYHAAIKKLQAAGGSLREIAEVLELSHQRVHQIVEGQPIGPPPWGSSHAHRRGFGHHRHGGRRGGKRFFLARFDETAKELMVEAHRQADGLRHDYVGTEHFMLGAVQRGRVDVSYDEARKQIVERIGEGDQHWIEGIPRPLTPRAKRVLENALKGAAENGNDTFGEDDIVLAMVEDSKGAGGEVLRDLGVTPEQLRERRGQ